MTKTAETARTTNYYRREYAHLSGRKIVGMRAMYPEEMELFLWSGEAGNGPGQLMIQEGRLDNA